MRLTLLLLFAAVPGCAPEERIDPVELPGDDIRLRTLTDLDPDPEVVEVRLVAGPAQVEYLPGQPADVWAYRDGADPASVGRVPGPLLEATRGDRVIVHFTNELERSTTVHWHGLRLPVEMDGSGEIGDKVFPGDSFVYDFVALDAGTFWYHPHVDSDEQIERGLHGAIEVRADDADRADRTLVLDDVKLDAAGNLSEETTLEDIAAGRIGNLTLVNGRADPTVRATAGSRERWRLINAANGRYFPLALGGAITVIGWDGGLVDVPYEVETLLIAPGERYDVLVDLDGEPGSSLELIARPHDAGHGAAAAVERILTVALDGREPLRATAPLPPEIERLPVGAATTARPFVLTGDLAGELGPAFYINGEQWPFQTPVEVALGDLEIWEVTNDGDGDHPLHLHGMFFQVLDRGGVPEPRLGWKDTVTVDRRSTTRFAVRYDAPGGWMFHCQVPEHAERGMMGELDVMPGR